MSSIAVVCMSLLFHALLDIRPRMHRLLQVLQIECKDSSNNFLSKSDVFNVNKGLHVLKEATR